jgi:phosphate transport system permease protein
MSAAKPDGLISSTRRADVNYGIQHRAARKQIAINRAVVRRSVSVIGGRVFALLATLVVLAVPVMLIALIIWSLPLIQQVSIDNLLGLNWNPANNAFGFTTFVVGSLWVTGLAMILAVPVSICSAVYLSEYVRNRHRNWLRPLVELLAGIPSVVYGLWGVLVIVPLVRSIALALHAEQTTGYGILSASLVLALMVTPFMIALMEEILRATPQGTRNAALALGATRWEVVRDVLFRQSRAGLIAVTGLGLARAVGETLAVMMLVANTLNKLPTGPLDGAYPLPALIANNFGEVMSVPLYYSALMLAALLLLIMILVFNIGSRLIIRGMAHHDSY